jgi:osmotically inducible protein OsmC
MSARSRASAHWEGTTDTGAGTVTTASDALHQHPLLWQARIGEKTGTTPEELLASAWAGCYAMAFGFELGKAGHPAKMMDVDAELAFIATDGGFEIGKGKLSVRADVPGIDNDTFMKIAEAAKGGCPVSVALGTIADDAKLEAKLTTAAAH